MHALYCVWCPGNCQIGAKRLCNCYSLKKSHSLCTDHHISPMANFIVPSLLLTFAAVSLLPSAAQTIASEGYLYDPPPPPPYHHLSSAWLLEPILANLGFHELSMAVAGLSDFPTVAGWGGPTTLFAPADASIESCFSCSVPRILAEHIVPGLFSSSALQELAGGFTTIETMNPGHCITVATSGAAAAFSNRSRAILIDGVEITRPDLFNNGLMIVHGLGDHLVSLLQPPSCSSPAVRSGPPPPPLLPSSAAAETNPRLFMSLMLRDAMIRLRSSGFSVLALALRERFEDLVILRNATLFAIEDRSVFSDPRNYAGNVWFHVVPNRFLDVGGLASLPAGSTFETMARGMNLTVTSSGGPAAAAAVEINGVRVKIPEVVKNSRIVAHSVTLPFLHSPSEPSIEEDSNRTAARSSSRHSIEDQGGCTGPTAIEDYHGL